MNFTKTPITDAAEYELQEAYESYDGLSSAPTKVVNPESMRELEIKYNEIKAKLEVNENNLRLVDKSLSDSFCKNFIFDENNVRKPVNYIIDQLIYIIKCFEKAQELQREISSLEMDRLTQVCDKFLKIEKHAEEL